MRNPLNLIHSCLNLAILFNFLVPSSCILSSGRCPDKTHHSNGLEPGRPRTRTCVSATDDGTGAGEYLSTDQVPTPPSPGVVASRLHGRLLCSSNVAYDASSALYLRGAGYRAGTQIQRLSRGVNSATVGWAPVEGRNGRVPAIFIAFRGTRPVSPLDWLVNAALQLSPFEIPGEVIRSVGKHGGLATDTMIMEAMRGSAGRVHSGFYYAATALYVPIRDAVRNMVAEWNEQFGGNGAAPEIYLTGHSKGGAVAALTAAFMKIDADIPDPSEVVTFGTPRLGDSEFRSYYNSMGIMHVSYEAYMDIIPLLPPSSPGMMEKIMTKGDGLSGVVDGMLWSDQSKRAKEKHKGYAWDFQTIGSRRYIDQGGQVVTLAEGGGTEGYPSDDDRIRDFERYTILGVRQFRSAHCPSCAGDACDGIYMRALAKEICSNCEQT